jgi:hypothetical protein
MNEPEAQQLFTMEGPIQALRIAPGIINLISDIQSSAFFTGAVTGLAGEAGVAANSASLVMYDGEDVEHIALLINGLLVVGTFEWLGDLHVGDHVKLVVSKIEDGPLFAHAILRNDDQLLWTPFSIHHTRHGWILHAVKLGLLGLIGTWLMLGSFYLFGSRPSAQVMVSMLCFTIVMITFVLFMSTKSVMHLGEQAEDIFRVLNVPKFERFRIKPYSVLNLNFKEDPNCFKKGHIFHFSDALAAHKKKFNLS